MPSPTLVRVIVSVANLADALRFYQQLLGLNVRQTAPGFTWLATADGVEILLHERSAHPSDTSVSLGLGVTGLDAVVARWVTAGGVVIDPPMQQPWGEYMAVVRDADGHVVCLSETR